MSFAKEVNHKKVKFELRRILMINTQKLVSSSPHTTKKIDQARERETSVVKCFKNLLFK